MLDFKTIPIDLKNYLITSVTLPFWYISIYYYFPSVYLKDDLLLIGSICVGLSVISNIITSALIITHENKQEQMGPFEFRVITIGIIIQCLWLSFLIFLGYLTVKITGYKFQYYGFLITYFSAFVAWFIRISIREQKNIQDKQNTLTKR